ncbi:MAG: alpha/beta fold hydrolase [Dehalococcoidia bacterium]
MLFEDRDDAGRRLAAAVKARGFAGAIVLGIPRGGVPVAAYVARAIGGTLGVVVARKLGAPGNPELAVGAVTADGIPWINEDLARDTGANHDYLDREIASQAREAARREAAFDGGRRPDVRGRAVIIVDDGIATGATALAAARSMRAAGAKPVVLAVPVGPPSTLRRLKDEADEVICLHEDSDFWAIGQFYRDFRPVEDDEVRRIIEKFSTHESHRDAKIRRGNVDLATRLMTPGMRAPAVVFVHGLGSSKESPRNVVIASSFVDHHVAAVLFDLSGHGDSSDDPREGLEAYVDDLAAVFDWATRQPEIDATRIAVAGSSLGAVVALKAVTEKRVQPAALVLRAPPASVEDFAGLDIPALLLVGSRDGLVTTARGAAAASKTVELRVVPGASHLFEEPGTLEVATETTVSWTCDRLAEGIEARATAR